MAPNDISVGDKSTPSFQIELMCPLTYRRNAKEAFLEHLTTLSLECCQA